MAVAADAIKALKYGDSRECDPDEEVGFLMLAKVFHCFVIDHSAKK